MYKFKIYIKERNLSQVDEKVAEIILIFSIDIYIYICVYVEFIEWKFQLIYKVRNK